MFRAFVLHHHVLLELGKIIARETAAVNSALDHLLPSSISSPFDKHGDLKRKGLTSQNPNTCDIKTLVSSHRFSREEQDSPVSLI